jgi:NAD(P)-dependent dehydrogenase (short-subunit alcohol dehydrogenase family)
VIVWRRFRGGAFVSFSTSVVGLAFPTYGAYSASKGAVEALTSVLARELRGRDVTVNTVAPGPTATELFLDGKDEETIAPLAAQPPLERLGTHAVREFQGARGGLDEEQKELIVTRTTELYVEIHGERARAATLVLVEEVTDGGWGIGGGVLRLAMLQEPPRP